MQTKAATLSVPTQFLLTLAVIVLFLGGQVTQAALAPIEKVDIGSNAEILVNDQPFLPIMIWAQTESSIVNGLAIGVNTFVGNAGKLTSRAFLDVLAQSGLYGVMDFDPQAIGHTRLLGWIHRDEPDLPGSQLVAGQKVPRMSVDAVAAAYQAIKQADATRPVFLTFTAHFMHEMDQHYSAAQKARIYPPMAQYTDVVGFDMYPIYGWNKPEWLYRVADGVSELRAIAGAGKPVYAWIETNKGSTAISAGNQLPVTPQDTRAEVWMALIRGATGIGYFTHSWTPTYTQFAPDAAMVAALKELNAQITRLAPALLADPATEVVGMTMSPKLACHFKQTKLDGDLWIFAQNIDMSRRTGTATFQIPGLRAGALIEVVDEGRFLVAQAGAFSDSFAPLQEHVYRVRPEPWVLIKSPQPQEQLTGDQPIDFQVIWEKQPTRIQVELDGRVIYTGDRLPASDSLVLDALQLEAGDHLLTVTIGDDQTSTTESVGFTVTRTVQITGVDEMGTNRVSGTMHVSTALTNLALAQMRLLLDEREIYRGSRLPQLSIDTTQLMDGSHQLEAQATDAYGRTTTHQLTFIVRNYKVVDDAIHPPGPLSFWGVSDYSKTYAVSAGWDYVDQNELLFGDDGRRVRRADTPEYMIWEAAALRKVTLRIYAQHNVRLDQSVHLYVSEDQKSWSPIAYEEEVIQEQSDGWRLFELKSSVTDQGEANWFKLVFQDHAPADGLQLGHVTLQLQIP